MLSVNGCISSYRQDRHKISTAAPCLWDWGTSIFKLNAVLFYRNTRWRPLKLEIHISEHAHYIETPFQIQNLCLRPRAFQWWYFEPCVMLPVVGTQYGNRPNRKSIYLILYTRQKHHSKSKIYVFDHELFHSDSLNPVWCYRKSEPKMAAVPEKHISQLVQ